MITNNFMKQLSLVLIATISNAKGLLAAKTTDGSIRYLMNKFNQDFPYSAENYIQITSNPYGSGVWLGKGTTTPTENDYRLDDRIASGLTGSTPTITSGTDGSGNPYRQLLFTVTNTTGSDITITEIGYVQKMPCTQYVDESSSMSSQFFLIDRTVLSNPVTVPANGSAAITYTLKTVIA